MIKKDEVGVTNLVMMLKVLWVGGRLKTGGAAFGAVEELWWYKRTILRKAQVPAAQWKTSNRHKQHKLAMLSGRST